MPNPKLTKFYTFLGLMFIFAAAVCGLAVAYFTMGKTEIYINSSYKKISADVLIDVKEKPIDYMLKDKEVSGKILAVDVEESSNFVSTGKKLVADDTVGELTIINNYSKNQPLIATTRFLSPDGVLLRLKNNVDVPAGGKVMATVYADDPKNFIELEPTKFIIPGLWEGLQDKIYAESNEVLKSGGRMVSVVEKDDLENAERILSEKLSQMAIEEANRSLTENEALYSKLIQKEIKNVEFSAQAGDEVSELSGKMEMRAIIVAFDELKLLGLVKQKLSSLISSDMKLNEIDKNSITYSVEKYDLESKEANLKVYAEGRAVLQGEGNILDKNALVNLNEKEILEYFSMFPEIQEVEVFFKPKWFKRASFIPERIEFIIQ